MFHCFSEQLEIRSTSVKQILCKTNDVWQSVKLWFWHRSGKSRSSWKRTVLCSSSNAIAEGQPWMVKILHFLCFSPAWEIWQLLSRTHHMSPGNGWKWKYDKQCEIMQTNQWKSPNFQIQCFFNGTSGALCWKRLKSTKTRGTETKITQNFEKIWPI